MATAEQLDLKAGDLVLWTYAHLRKPGVIFGGIQLNTKGATVSVGVGKKIGEDDPRIESLSPDFRSCNFLYEILATHNPPEHQEIQSLSDIFKNILRVREIKNGIYGYGGDLNLMVQMYRLGFGPFLRMTEERGIEFIKTGEVNL